MVLGVDAPTQANSGELLIDRIHRRQPAGNALGR